MNPLGIFHFIGELICETVLSWASWRVAVCLFAGLGAAWIILELVSATPLRWMLAAGAVGFGIFLGDRWERGVS